MTYKENLLAWLRRESCEWIPEDATFTAAGLNPNFVDIDLPICERPMTATGYDVFSVHWTAAVEGCHWTQEQDVVLKDICNWRNEVRFPKVENMDWDYVRKQVEGVDRNAKVISFCSMMGCFERSTTLSTFTDCLTNTLVETEEYAALINAIADYKIALINKLAEVAKPDIMCYHDDWGTMRSPFLSRELWRETIFGATKRIFDACRANDILICLHSCGNVTPLVPDMIELGANVWEGQAACNDLPALYEKYNDQLRISMFSMQPRPEPEPGAPLPPNPFVGKSFEPYPEKPEWLYQ